MWWVFPRMVSRRLSSCLSFSLPWFTSTPSSISQSSQTLPQLRWPAAPRPPSPWQEIPAWWRSYRGCSITPILSATWIVPHLRRRKRRKLWRSSAWQLLWLTDWQSPGPGWWSSVPCPAWSLQHQACQDGLHLQLWVCTGSGSDYKQAYRWQLCV